MRRATRWASAGRSTLFRIARTVEPNLLDRRLLVVTGKGGVGKSTVAAALALVASQQGQRVLVVPEWRVGHAFQFRRGIDRRTRQRHRRG